MGRSSSTEMGWKAANLLQQDRRLALTNKYAGAVPTAEALATVARHGPVIEAGAGSGYWTRVDLPSWGCNAGWLWDALHVFDRLAK